MEFKVLIIDDDKISVLINNNVIKKSLFHLNPLLFINSIEALEYFRNNNFPDIIYCFFLDINMPLMTGWEFLDALNKEEIKAEISVVMVSSSIDYYDRQKATLYSQVIAFYEKPISVKTVEELKNHANFKSCFNVIG